MDFTHPHPHEHASAPDLGQGAPPLRAESRPPTNSRRSRLKTAARVALQVAGVAALTTGGIALGRGVVALTGEHQSPVASAAAEDATPSFASTVRSWATKPIGTGGELQASASAERTAPDVPPPPPAAGAAETMADARSTLAGMAAVPGIGTDEPPARPLIPATGIGGLGAAMAAAPPVQVPTAVPAPAAPAETTISTASPDSAVRSFYALLQDGDFDSAAGLWTTHMRGAYPPAENIYSRFARTQALTVQRADVVGFDAAAGRATVAIDLTEVLAPQAATRRYVGTWQLVRGPSGWLLDQPNLRLG